jgi:antitoxin (DNA-binding transcriptional repressor) of toxin-antitoxin stability system
MDKEKQVKEPAVVYAAAPTLDLSRLTVIQQEGRPVAVVVPYDEYQRLIDERQRAREDWRKRFEQLLADIQSRIPDVPPEEIEADITVAFNEMKAERYGARAA